MSAFGEGYDSGMCSYEGSKRLNPFQKGTVDNESWSKGYDQAKTDILNGERAMAAELKLLLEKYNDCRRNTRVSL